MIIGGEEPKGSGSVVRDRAIGVFKFLRDLTQLRSKTVRDIAQYEFVWWLADLPHESGCHFIGWQVVSEVDPGMPWVEIKKPKISRPPETPTSVQPWVTREQISDSSVESPQLEPAIEVTVDGDNSEPQIRILEDYPDVVAAWQRYVETQWRPWAAGDRIKQRIQLEYSNLFSIYQKQKTLGENYEIVLCFGFLTWRSGSMYEVARHLITAQCSVAFDDVRGVMTVGPAADGARLTLDQDMLDPGDMPDHEDLEEQLRDSEFVMWDGQTIPNILRAWVHRLSAAGEYNDSISNHVERSSTPTVSLAPAIVVRRRGDRTILRLFKGIIEKYEAGSPPSAGIASLVFVDEPARATSTGDNNVDDNARPLVDELYLPLPSNAEQRLIVERLQNRQGILVQGPPGTGKSHTIANLLCHLLAQGKRVLVTSHTARALAVLKRKLPTQIADLCVMLLGDDLTALQGLENSVREITERYNNRSDELSLRRIAKLEKQLAAAREVGAVCQQELRAIRESETFVYNNKFRDYSGTSQAIAQELREREPLFEWIVGLIDEAKPIPLTDSEALELLDLTAELDDALVAATKKIRPRSGELPDPIEFSTWLSKLERTKGRSVSLESEILLDSVQKFQALDNAQLEHLRSLVSRIVKAAGALDASGQWAVACRNDVLARNPHVWRELLAATNRHLEEIGDRSSWANDRRISGIDGLDATTILADATDLFRHLRNGRGLGFGPFRPAVVKRGYYVVKNVCVDGKPAKSTAIVDQLRNWLEVVLELQNLENLWKPFTPISATTISIRTAQFTSLRDKLSAVMEIQSLTELADKYWRDLNNVEPLWTNHDDLQQLARALDYICARREFEEALEPLTAVEQQLRRIGGSVEPHELCPMLSNAIEARDNKTYGLAYRYLISIEASAAKVERRTDLALRLKATAPRLFEYAEDKSDSETRKSRFGKLSSAWQWAQANAWLKDIADPSRQRHLENEIDRSKMQIGSSLAELAAEKAWRWCFSSMTETQRRHLVGWQQEIKRLGKGTGKHAARHRQHAREELEGARGAVPAWVMPIYRLADTIKVDSEPFDVVIIDEASQSGPDSMFLLEFAKQIIIVGDDKQIKPEAFVDQNVVETLRRRHISDVPSSTLIGSADTSLFEIGELLYGGRVRLREHFRCMPEIIQFSNNLCYASEPLIPLKQFGGSRLKPVVSTRHVSTGYQKGSSPRIVNPPEADAVVEFIAKAIHDDRYAKKTFGVISLLGIDQAKLVEQGLLERIGPEEIQRRQLVCGDAYAFQGDERDVMLLSLVSAPTQGSHIGVLSKQSDERRFNVAASRAKEQMILFHTATINDLNPKCLRHRLLEYCLNPQVDPLEVAGIKISVLREMAASSARHRTKPPIPFDSWFEVDVCIMIAERGFRVVPQYQIAGYFVDLMAEGMHGRIAVECDGDEWHGADRYDEDISRQRELERAGLCFFRPRGSEFYRNPLQCMAPLWDLLAELGSEDTAPKQSAHFSAPPQPEITPAAEEMRPRTTVSSPSPTSEVSAGNFNLEVENLEPELPLDRNLGWADNSLEESSGSDEFAGSSQLPPYQAWKPQPLQDPRTCSADEIIRGLVDIVTVEGPVMCTRMYHQYARSAGISRIGNQLRSIFNRAAARAVRQGLLVQSSDQETIGQLRRVVHLPGTSATVPRRRGARLAEELPTDEIIEVLNMVSRNGPMTDDELIQKASYAFAVGRLTTNTRQILQRAIVRWRSQK